MIVPDGMVEAVEKIASSLAICAPTLAQHAALACFTDDALKTFAHRREAFKQRRDYLLPEFERLGLRVPVKPDGAFYIYADISDLGMDSAAFSQRLLLEAGVAAVPTSVRPTATTPCASPMPPAWTAWKRPSIAWASCWVTEPAFGFHEATRPSGRVFLWPGRDRIGINPWPARCPMPAPGAGARPAPWRHNRCRRGRLRRHNRPVRHRPSRAG